MGARSRFAAALAAAAVLAGCSFNYGELSDEAAADAPDLVMTDVEYVRVRDGKPVVRLQADTISRYEKGRRMTAESPRFEQYNTDGSEGARGGAASATVNLETGDVILLGGVSLSVPHEDIVMETGELKWLDKDRQLQCPPDLPLLVKRGDGSFLSGLGFQADSRSKRWSFAASITGSYVDTDDGKEPPGASVEGAKALPEPAVDR